ncbi:hypothetical protein P153DRAFT_370881 [Dothidotthia symphoricarpi CBS 119687]|uniref:Uncharacterized protein n=1 Tax=Dothidotthia symphoricarpi CBS 119687 TaxID=1392245 RepID=A0A6A6A0G8_9PLEO|nr:uncharacterized protein P153DRAFT_370881 [Dothidotthia symphoricarpi CBS 119687]KAF2124457.1 hypothetical protein P153DRAFT_370881 [Dothidotthia symphoricarpi CBS 119687]
MKFSIVAAALSLPCAMAMPSESGQGRSLLTRATPKLNQYATLDDCQNDRNILYHAAPVAFRCYELDGKTGAFFYNTGPYLESFVSGSPGCNPNSPIVEYISGSGCRNKGASTSVQMS